MPVRTVATDNASQEGHGLQSLGKGAGRAIRLMLGLTLGLAACAGGGASGNTGGTSGGSGGAVNSGGSVGTGGVGAVGSGGANTGGAVGTGGGSGGAAGAVATGGNAGGMAGTGVAGQAGGSGGSSAGGGGGSAFVPYACPPGPYSPDLSTLGTPTRINNAPPSDSFNNNGNNFTIIEAPVWITDAIYVSEFGSMTAPPPSRIIKIDESDNVTIAFPSISDTGSNGLAFDASGRIVTANHGVGGIVAFTLPSGTPTTTLTSMYMGTRFDSPNDLTLRGDGTIYFTDFSGSQTPSPAPQAAPRVFMLPPGSSTVTALFTDNSDPNGIALSLDQKTLYVGDGAGVKQYAVNFDGTINATGTAVDSTDLNNQNTDGMVFDCAGDLYVVRVNQHDIVVVSPAGQKLANITVPGGGQITKAAFGGSDHQTLYIAAMGTGTTRGVFKLAMPVPGMPF